MIPASGRFLEKGMATQSSILAWKIPWTEELDGVQSMGLQRVGHDGATNTCGMVRSTLSTIKLFAGVLDRSENWISLVHSFGKDKIFSYLLGYNGLLWWLRWERICLQSRRPRFDPSVGKILWRREWQPNPVFLPGESHGQRSQACCSPWGHKMSDMTE